MNPLLLGPLFDAIKLVLGRVIPDKEAQAKAEMELAMVAQSQEFQLIAAQIDVNAKEAQSSSIFVAGWRPAIGWICGLAFLYQYVAMPIGIFAYTTYTGHPLPVPPPKLDDTLYELLFGMLGLGTLRTVEKVKGVAK